ncbi:MAG: hypothetical protein E7561_05915 [Ruminococcaceae bacterium]|nr:hypothetical protein [Oscillospiraceae bacterium]
MKMKKLLSLVLAIVFICGIFASVPFVNAAAPAERIEVILEGEYYGLSPFGSSQDIYEVFDENGSGLYSVKNGWITECQWEWICPSDEIPFSEVVGFYAVQGENGYGLLNANGEIVIEATYDELYLEGGIATVCENGLYGIVDTQGNTVLEPQCDGFGMFCEGITQAYKDGKVGFVNTAGRWLAEPIYSEAQNFSEGFGGVKNDEGKWGYIDTNGEVVFPLEYDNISEFRNGYALAEKGEKTFIIDTNGNKVITDGTAVAVNPGYDCTGQIETLIFSGANKDIACVKLEGEENYCYIDRNFNVLTESIYPYPVMFTEEDYAVTILPNRFGVENYTVLTVDRTNGISIKTAITSEKPITDLDFDGTPFFQIGDRLYDIKGQDLFGMDFEKFIYLYDNSNLINAVYEGQYACVNFEGELISPLSDFMYERLTEDIYAAVADDGRVKLCDKSGKQLENTEEYAEAYIEDSFIFVMDNDGKWGVLDEELNVVLEPFADGFSGVSEGMLKYRENGKYGFINIETGERIPANFTKTSDFENGYCWVSENVLIGAIDKSGKYIVEPLYWGYDDCTGFGGNPFNCGVTSIQKKNGGFGVINMQGEKLVNFEYSYISPFNSDGVAYFDKDGSTQGIMRVVTNTATEKPAEITTEFDEIVVYKGCYDVIKETVTPRTAADIGVSFKSANTAVATVDSVGRVYGVSEGNTTVTITANADDTVIKTVNIKVEDRELHDMADLIPLYAWEDQLWLADVVVERLYELGVTKTVEELTYGDLLTVREIEITELPTLEGDSYYFIPSIIGEFSNLVEFKMWFDIFTPIVTTQPDEVKFLSNLWRFYAEPYNTYGESYDETIIRNNQSGIPDKNLYKAQGICREGDYMNRYLSNLGIADLTGLALLRFYADGQYLILSHNYITDISELTKLPEAQGGHIDLSYNNLDLNDEQVIADLNTIMAKGYNVETYNQFCSDIIFYEYDEQWGEMYEAMIGNIRANVSDGCEEEMLFRTYPEGVASEFDVVTTDESVVTGYIEDKFYEHGYDGKLYNHLVLKYNGVGNAKIYIMHEGRFVKELDVSVNDDRFFVEDIIIHYNVPEYDPYYANIYCENEYNTLEYRKLGETAWQQYYGMGIKDNGTYEFRYSNQSGMYSNIATLEITGIMQTLSYEQMPDTNLRNCFNNGNPYENFEVDYFHATFSNISDLKGLSLLDFSNCYDYWINFNNNYITDISELAKVGFKNKTINLTYNRIDFTQPQNTAALKKLISDGCEVLTDNQFYTKPMTMGNNYTISTENSTAIMQGMISEGIYNLTDTSKITAAVDGETDVISITSSSYDPESRSLNIFFEYGENVGKADINIIYDGQIIAVTTIRIVRNHYDLMELDAPEIYVSIEDGFRININNTQDAWKYQYRKLGDTEWIEEQGSFRITEEGVYEFRYINYQNQISKTATQELATATQDGLTYCLNSDGWSVFEADYPSVPAELVIPETINGYPVTDISMIYDCYNLQSISVPKTVERMGSLNNCPNLTTINIAADNPYISYSDGFIIDKKQKAIEAFFETTAEEITIPEGIEQIYGLGNLWNVKKINIPKSVLYIIPSVFNSVYNLETITVDSENPVYYVNGGMLYKKYTGTVVACPSNLSGKLEIPEGTLFIEAWSFNGTSANRIKIPSSVLMIGGYAFAHSSVPEVDIENGVLAISYDAFFGCYNLKKLFVPESVTNITSSFIDSSVTTLYCIENSVAHQFAINNGYNYKLVKLGDLDFDGTVSANDLAGIKKTLLLVDDFSTMDHLLCDINGDGAVNILDFIKFQKDFTEDSSDSETVTEVAAVTQKTEISYVETQTSVA